MITLKEKSRTLLVPSEETLFGVTSDKKVETRQFEIPRMTANGKDLSSFALRINYFNAENTPGQYSVKDAYVNGDKISFSWEFSGKVTAEAGKVRFIICAVSIGEYGEIVNEWNTEPAEGIVKKGLEVSSSDNDYEEEDIPAAVENALLLINQRAQEVLDSIPDDYTTLAETVDGLKEDVSKISEEIIKLKNQGAIGGTGLSTEAIDKLEEVGNYLAYTTADGGSKWTELIAILRNGSSGGGSGEIITATGITLNKTTLSFTDSVTQTLTAIVEPSNSTDSVAWESSDAGIATVSNGVVTPISNGSCTIIAKAGSYSAICNVTVDIEEEIVTLSSISATYEGGDVSVGTSLDDLTGITIIATYSDGSTSNVTDYTLSGEILEGENTVTVSYSGKTTTFTVTGVAESNTLTPIDKGHNTIQINADLSTFVWYYTETNLAHSYTLSGGVTYTITNYGIKGNYSLARIVIVKASAWDGYFADSNISLFTKDDIIYIADIPSSSGVCTDEYTPTEDCILYVLSAYQSDNDIASVSIKEV